MAKKKSVFDDLDETSAGSVKTPDAPTANPYPPGSEEAYWFEHYSATAQPQKKKDIFSDLEPAGTPERKPEPKTGYQGSILPFTRNSEGTISFDPWNAGPTGAMKQAVTLPGRVYSGETKIPWTFDPSVTSRKDSSNIMGEVLNFATSAPFMPNVNPAIRSGDRVIPGVAKRKPDYSRITPEGGELKETGGKQIESYKNLDIKHSPGYIGQKLASDMEQALLNMGIMPENSKQLYAFVNRLKKYTPKSDDPSATISVGPKNLTAMRENLTNLYGKPEEHQKGVYEVHQLLDKFITNPPPESIIGDPSSIIAPYGGKLYERGRGNYAAGMRDEELGKIAREEKLRTASANSGMNADNTLRSKITSAILNAKKIKGFDPDEVAALEAVPEGTLKNNLMRWGGNFLGGGGGLGAHITSGAGFLLGNFMGGPNAGWMMAPWLPAAGAALKKAAGTGTREALEDVRSLTRQRSPLFEERLPGADTVPEPPALTDPYNSAARTITRPMVLPEGIPVPTEALPPGPGGDHPTPEGETSVLPGGGIRPRVYIYGDPPEEEK